MKKIFLSMLAISMATFTFTSCEDVPEPYGIPGTEIGGGDADITEEPVGDGTQANPFNALAITNLVSAMPAGVESTEDYYIKGVVVSIKENFTTQYGNAAFYIADSETGTTQFYVFRTLYLGNKKYTSGDVLKVGDEVVVCGKVVNYMGNTPETVQNQSYLVSINGKTSSEGGNEPSVGEAKGDGTVDNPFNSVAANQFASSLAAGTNSDIVYVKGKVVSIKENYTTQFGNAAFYISDDGTATNQFYVFRALYLNNEKYTSGDLLSVGDDVVICGKLTNYMGNTPETVQGEAYLYSWTQNGGSTGGDEIGDLNAANGDFEAWVNGLPNNWKTASTACNATLSQSTDAHSGSYSVNVGGTTAANKRIGYKEMELKAGDYTMTFYAKAATSAGASVRPGYVPVTDGKVGNYVYGDYTNNLSSTTWTQVTHTFNIASDGTYCLVIMNSKNPGADVLIDDFTLTMGNTVIIK